MFTAIISSKKYWITVVVLALGFIVVFSIIEHIMQNGGIDLDTFLNEKINEGRWLRYFISRIAGGLAYGMIMGYYLELRKRISKR